MTKADPTLDLFAVCPPGLEEYLAAELSSLEIAEPTNTAGGVAWCGDLTSAFRANLESGLASQVLVRVAEFGARSLADLDRRGARVEWRRWLPAGTTVTVKASCRRSRIYHSGAAAERIERHLREQVQPLDGDDPIAIRVRIHENRCTISLDSSGVPLHRRGWRLAGGKAPLREDLARALVVASGWDRRCPLLDPLMGSGTILIEAAGLARGLAPGRLRSFALERLALSDPDLFAILRDRAREREIDRLDFRLFGSDRDAGALVMARDNAGRAGVLDDLCLRTASLAASLDELAELPARGVLVTNPPYGKRLGNPNALANLYQTLGGIARRLPEGWHVALAAADRRLALRSGIPLTTAFLAESGGLKIRALTTTGTGPRSSDP